MEFPLVFVNFFIRSRHRWLYFQGCLFLLMLILIVLFTVLVIPATTTFVPIVERSASLNRVDLTESRRIVKATENSSGCATLITPKVQVSNVETSPTQEEPHTPVPTIFAITPTRKRLTQLLDLSSLCQTLINIHHLIWIVVESSTRQSLLVTELLNSCEVDSVHLTISRHMMPSGTNSSRYGMHIMRRGVREKNVGMEWIRHYCNHSGNCSGVVYFLDDDCKYDVRLFDVMRQVVYVGVWPVAFAGQIKFEGPICTNGTIVEWHSLHSERPFPISSLGFAMNVKCLLDKPKVVYGLIPRSHDKSAKGLEESQFLSNFLESTMDDRLECKGSDNEVYVWQVKSVIDPYLAKTTYHGKYRLKT